MSLTREDINMAEALKNNLLELQQSLSARIEAIKKDFSKGRSADFSEQATEQENEEVLVQLKVEAEEELRLVNIALDKIANGGFGECEKCYDEIARARLEAIPYTKYCIKCA